MSIYILYILYVYYNYLLFYTYIYTHRDQRNYKKSEERNRVQYLQMMTFLFRRWWVSSSRILG
jgi:predicted membrane protein